MKDTLIIFVKEPKKGKVKTRLQKTVSQEDSVGLYKAFLKDTLDIGKRIKCEKIIAYDSQAEPLRLRRIFKNFKFYKQKGRDLGKRMHNAFKFAKDKNSSKTIIIGSDSPDLPPCFIERAFHKLDKSDVALGPSRDGGYYLIGLKNVCPGLFKSVKWSSGKALDKTVENARGLKKSLSILKEWHDVDDPESLEYLKRVLKREKDNRVAKWTRRFLKI